VCVCRPDLGLAELLLRGRRRKSSLGDGESWSVTVCEPLNPPLRMLRSHQHPPGSTHRQTPPAPNRSQVSDHPAFPAPLIEIVSAVALVGMAAGIGPGCAAAIEAPSCGHHPGDQGSAGVGGLEVVWALRSLAWRLPAQVWQALTLQDDGSGIVLSAGATSPSMPAACCGFRE
jgi:hypothetical protein